MRQRLPHASFAVVIVAIAAFIAPASVGAQAPPRSVPGQERPNARAGMRNPQAPPPNANVAQVEQYFDTYFVMQARNVLQLQDDQFFAVAPRIERLQNLRRRLQRERQRVIQELAEILKAPGAIEDAAVAPRIKVLDDQGTASTDEIRKAYLEIDQVLTPRQRAQFRVFEMRMERQKLDLLAAARGQGRGGQSPNPPPPPPQSPPPAAGAGSL